MNSTEAKDRFRSEVSDTEEPYLWSDGEVFEYTDDAQKMFVRKTGGLGDASTDSVTLISAPINTDWVDLSPLILKTREAYRVSNGRPVTVINVEDMAALNLRFDGRTGPPQYLILGLEKNRARVYPITSEADSIRLVVDRLPLKKITDAGDQKFEIDEQHHRHLLDWVKHLAYAKQDADAYDRNKSLKFEASFLNYCESARLEKERAKHKTRVVVYGGL